MNETALEIIQLPQWIFCESIKKGVIVGAYA